MKDEVIDILISKQKHLKEEFENFQKTLKKYKYISLFGVGKRAENWGYEFVKEWAADNIICFSDNNTSMWGKTIIDNLRCIPPYELEKYGKDVITVLLVQETKQDEIARQMKGYGVDTIGVKIDWLCLDCLIEKFLDIKLPNIWEGESEMGRYYKNIDKNERIAVFTCIVNGYDRLIQPLVIDTRCDYYFLGLEKPENLGVYQWIDIHGIFPEYLNDDFTRINRYCKLHPHILFPQYNYSIYIDGSVQIHTKISHLINKIGRVGIASYGMPTAVDIYEHGASLWFRNARGEKNGRERIQRQMQKYVTEGFPRYFGLSENTIMVREHHNKECVQIMNTWWDEIRNYSRRDQLSFFYSIWKNGFVASDIGYINCNFRNGPEFSLKVHKQDNDIKKFIK